MKTRNGFVSNSSSSSFIVNDKSFNNRLTIGEIAYEILAILLKEKESNDDFNNKDTKAIKKALKWLEKNLFYNKPILLPWTCNYNTWIWRNENNKIRVATSHHLDLTDLYGTIEYNDDDETWSSLEKIDDKFLDLEDMSIDTYNNQNAKINNW